MTSSFKAAILAAVASLALAGAANAQIGRSSKNPEAGPAGATMRYGTVRRGAMSHRRMHHRRMMRHHRRHRM